MSKAALTEQSRIKLLSHYIGDVRAWKADDAAETVILGVKDPARDADDQSFYAMARSGALTYLGTTALGKDGGCQPVVYNDGTVALLLSEVPDPTQGAPGALADLYLVTLQYKVGAELAAGTGTVDQVARNRIQGLAAALVQAAGQFD